MARQAKRFVIGITGASGTVYGERLVEVLLEKGHSVDLVVTRAGYLVGSQELGWPPVRDFDRDSSQLLKRLDQVGTGRLRLYHWEAIDAPIASGSVAVDGVVIIPASMASIAAIATGQSGNLLERAADVALKEGRPLIVVPRETPLNRIHLRNLLTLAEAGATVMPAMPGFYHKPVAVRDLVDFMVGKVLNRLGLEQELLPPYTNSPESSEEDLK